VLRVSVAAEKAGVPAVSVIATPFLTLARSIAKGLGSQNPTIAEYPGVPMIDTDEQLRDKVVNKLLPAILEGWGTNKRKTDKPRAENVVEPARRDIVFKGTYEEVQDYFEEQAWSDGLPVSPPTLGRVDAFLKYTNRDPDEVLGVCQPEYRQATIWNIAVNGVMAGCRPEYMPVLIAIVEAMTDPKFFLEDAGSTPGWEPLVILNGPIIKELDFNYAGGVLRVGRRANSSIGRFVRLYIRNVPGQRIPPFGTDKGSIGMSFNVVLAENEDAVAALGWEPFSVDQGYRRSDNVVTVQSVISVSQPVYTAGKVAQNHVQILAEAIGQLYHYRSYTGIRHRKLYPLFLLGPAVAKAIADDGWSKDDIRNYLYDHITMPASTVERYARNTAQNDYSLKDFAKRGMIPQEYYQSDDPDRMVRVLVQPEWTGIVVAGDPGRNQSKGFVQNHRQGVPVSKKINLPSNWNELLAKSKRA